MQWTDIFQLKDYELNIVYQSLNAEYERFSRYHDVIVFLRHNSEVVAVGIFGLHYSYHV